MGRGVLKIGDAAQMNASAYLPTMEAMPTLEGWLHYRNVDVSTIKELSRRWYPRTYFQAPTNAALAEAFDKIAASLSALRLVQ